MEGTVFGEVLIYEPEEFLAYVGFDCLVEWWVEPNDLPFAFFFVFGCSGCFIPQSVFVAAFI